jgi:hypothetical protein
MPHRPLRLAFAALATSLLLACGADVAPEPVPAPEVVAPGPRALVTADGGIRVVLRSGVEASMGHGALALLSAEAPVVVRRDVHREGLTSEELRWIDRTVVLHDEHGVACEGIVEDVELLGRFHLDDGTRMDWFDDDENLRVSPEQMAERAWEEAPTLGSLDLTGRVRVVSGDCRGAVWAQLGGEAIPPTATAEPASPELRDLALAALRVTDDYRQAQESYEAFQKDAPEGLNTGGFPARWEDYHGSSSVTLIAHPGGETLIATSIQAGEGCGDFLGSAFRLWRLHGDALEPIPADALSVDSVITGATDVDGDGHLDRLTPSGYVRQSPRGFDDARSTEIPANAGCGC